MKLPSLPEDDQTFDTSTWTYSAKCKENSSTTMTDVLSKIDAHADASIKWLSLHAKRSQDTDWLASAQTAKEELLRSCGKSLKQAIDDGATYRPGQDNPYEWRFTATLEQGAIKLDFLSHKGVAYLRPWCSPTNSNDQGSECR